MCIASETSVQEDAGVFAAASQQRTSILEGPSFTCHTENLRFRKTIISNDRDCSLSSNIEALEMFSE